MNLRFSLFTASLFAVIYLTGCADSGSNDGLTFNNDMETTFAFNEHPASNIVYFKNAHSGRYVSIIDTSNIWCGGFNMKVKDIDPAPLSKVTIGAWMYAQQPNADAQLAIDIRDKDGNTLDWLGQPAHDFLTTTVNWTWVQMEVDLSVKNRNNIDNTYRIYVVNNTGSAVLVDDLKIRFEK
ncbi:MAG: hypothetical protein NTV09_02375 [Bacteroidetes bacterium]|nr:hypothetical protein [Bacteroidota bacterium]